MSADPNGMSSAWDQYMMVVRTRDLQRQVVENLLTMEAVALVDHAMYLHDQIAAMERSVLESQRAALLAVSSA